MLSLLWPIFSTRRRLQCALTIADTLSVSFLPVTLFQFYSYACDYLVLWNLFFVNKVHRDIERAQLPKTETLNTYNERLDGANEEAVARSFFEHGRSHGVEFHLLDRVQLQSQLFDGGVQLILQLTAACPQHINRSRR